jgi:hypothetical protein
METYLDHPQHGAQVVHSKADLDLAISRGWKVRDPQPGVVKPTQNPLADSMAVTLDRAKEAKRVRKPKGTSHE